jgi:hypothetical protein
VGELIVRDFARILRDQRIGGQIVHRTTAGGGAEGALAGGGGQRDRRVVHGEVVEVRLEIFEVEREVQDVGVGWRRRRLCRCGAGHRECAAHSRCAQRCFKECAAILATLYARVERGDHLFTIGHTDLPIGGERGIAGPELGSKRLKLKD